MVMDIISISNPNFKYYPNDYKIQYLLSNLAYLVTVKKLSRAETFVRETFEHIYIRERANCTFRAHKLSRMNYFQTFRAHKPSRMENLCIFI